MSFKEMGKILSIGILLFACFGAAEAQISSAAFDPNCYQPRLGVPSEIDSIYGSQDQQGLGEVMAKFPKSKDFPQGSVAIMGLPKAIPFLAFVPNGSLFNLHNLEAHAKQSNLPTDFGIYGFKFGHFHDTKHTDLFVNRLRRVYWADDNGNYDSSRHTDLMPRVISTNGFSRNLDTYVTFLTSDTVCDFVQIVTADDSIPPYERLYLMLFHGGEHLLNQGKIAYQDSSYQIQNPEATLENRYLSMYFLQGDFRGTGRQDLIVSAACTSCGDSGNWFFYKNDPPFAMSNFANAIYDDTLMAVWENEPLKNNFYAEPLSSALADQVLPHPVWDNSVDIIMPLQDKQSSDRRNNVQLVLRGGQNFGQSRIYLQQAEQVLHAPWFYDNSFFEVTLDGMFTDCGDMTSTGYKVLFQGSAPANASYQLFYLTGKAFDDKADIFYSYATQGHAGFPVPFDADGDKYGDILLSDPAFTSKDDFSLGKRNVGTMHLLRGSDKIPIRLNPKYSVEERNAVDAAPWHITAYPNPCDEKTVLTFDNCTTSRMKIQVCTTDGRIVQKEETPAVDGLQQYALYLPSLSPGMYVVRLSCPALGWTGSVNIVKTGMVQGPGNFDLKKMVGR